MPDNIDPEQISALNENLARLVEATGGLGARSGGAAKSLGEMAGLGKTTTSVLGILGSSAASVSSALYKGEKGAKVFSGAIEEASNALTLLVLAIPGLGIAAKVAAVAANLFAKGLNAASKQGDALYKTYQDLQKSGATAADGITGVFNNMQKFGYGIEELDKMVKLVSENSETLAKFSLTAADGTSAFAGAMQGLTRDPALKLLGKMPDEVNAAGAAYIKQSVAAGLSQKQIGDNLGASTKQYIMDLDRLQRLTGTSADALQKQQDEAMSEDAYNDVMSDLKARAESGDAAATAQIQKITATMASLSPEMQKEFQKSLGGDLSAQQKLMMRMPTLMKNVTDESVSISQTMADGKKDIDNYVATYGKSYRLNAEGMREFGGGLRSAREEALQFGSFDERDAAAKKNATVTDNATKNLSDLDLQNMNSRDALQSFVQLGVAPATKAMAGFAKIASGTSGLLPGAGPAGENSVDGKLDAMVKAGSKTVPTGTGAAPAGPATTPTTAPAKPATGTQKEFLDTMYKTLLDEAKKQGVKNPEVIAKLGTAQSALETGYGKSHAGSQNYFGIKARPGENGSGGVATQEFINGKMVTVTDKFRKYGSMQESAADYVKFLQENKRYQGVLGATNLNDAITAQGRTGYATDPQYTNKLSGIAGKITDGTSNAKPKDASQLATAGDSEHTDLLSKIAGYMESMNYHTQKTADNTHKTAKNTQG